MLQSLLELLIEGQAMRDSVPSRSLLGAPLDEILIYLTAKVKWSKGIWSS